MEMPEGLTYDHIYKMMHHAFVEIRMNESENKVYSISHIYHNVPLMLKNNRPIEDVWDEMQSKADWLKIPNYVTTWANHVMGQKS